jgi:hypothetical protein
VLVLKFEMIGFRIGQESSWSRSLDSFSLLYGIDQDA